MTPRELSLLRNRVARARLARERARRDARPSTLMPSAARCVYCGNRLPARHHIACAKHRDLLAVDPKYVALAYLAKGVAA